MCAGIALRLSDLPAELITHYDLEKRIDATSDPAEPMVRLLYRDRVPLLPVREGNLIDLLLWGNRDDKESRLPKTGWCRLESLEKGKWNFLEPKELLIPAQSGLEKGVWFEINKGIRGIEVLDERQLPHVYMVTEPASDAYRRMTRHDRMPVLF
jgi:hypothetical protein